MKLVNSLLVTALVSILMINPAIAEPNKLGKNRGSSPAKSQDDGKPAADWVAYAWVGGLTIVGTALAKRDSSQRAQVAGAGLTTMAGIALYRSMNNDGSEETLAITQTNKGKPALSYSYNF